MAGGGLNARIVVRRVVNWFHISEADVRKPSTHWTYLGICAVFLLLPFFLSSTGGEAVLLAGHRVPGTCLSRDVFHTDCPGCGMTRSFVALTHGRICDALAFHRLGIALYVFFLWQAGYRLYCLRKRCVGIPHSLLRVQSALGFGMVALLMVNWFVGLFIGGN